MRVKLLLLLGVTFMVLFTSQYLIGRHHLRASFQDLDFKQAELHTGRILVMLQSRLEALGDVTQEWAQWDESYRFARGHNPDFKQSTLNYPAFEHLHLTALLYVDRYGRLIYGRQRDTAKGNLTAPEPGLLTLVKHDGPLFANGTPRQVTGFVRMDGVPAYLAAAPILTSQGRGPVAGLLVMIRKLDTRTLKSELASISALPVSSSFTAGSHAVIHDLGWAKTHIDLRPDPHNSHSVIILRDIYGQPGIQLHLALDRASRSVASRSLHDYLITSLAVLLPVLLLGFWLHDRLFLHRLTRLGREIAHIGQSGGLGERVKQSGDRDEIARLEQEINLTLTRLEQVHEGLQESESRYREIFVNNTAIKLLIDPESGQIVDANPAAAVFYGYPLQTLKSMNIDVINTLPRTDLVQRMQSSLSNRQNIFHFQHRLACGEVRDVQVFSSPVTLQGRRLLYSIVQDVTAEKQAHDALREEKEWAQTTLSSLLDAVISCDARLQVDYLNASAQRLLGLGQDEVAGHPIADVITLVDDQDTSQTRNLVEQCQHSGATQQTLRLRCNDGNEYTVQAACSPTVRAGLVMVLHDITQLRTLSQHLSYQTTHDPLTGLINRREFERRLQEAVILSEMNEGPYTLCYLDLDQFKLINDTSGHIAGDQLLKEVAGMLQARVRKTDTLARLGGDEFGLLLSGCDLDQAIQLADTILKHLNESSFRWDDKQFRITASIGIVSVSGNEGTMEDILSAADTACYIAKESGRNRAHVHTIDDGEVAYRRNEMLWVERIYKALDEDRFALHFQPIHPINGHSNDERFFEALLRLNNDQGPPTCPATFIPAAERFGAMPRLDRWVLGKAAATLRTHGNEDPPVCLSVNLSGHSLGDEGFLAFAYDLMRDTQIADRLCFEITETAAIANLAQARSFIHEMKQLGCRFALDDFGSGLSSFQYLKNLHVDYLKIEGSFVSSLLNDPIDLAMVRSINEVGHAIGLQTIAEYVESAEILQTLRELGVDYAQGFHIGHPVENLTLALTHST